MTNKTPITPQSQTDDNMTMDEKLKNLEHENAMLKQENDRLNQELASAFYMIEGMRNRAHSNGSSGLVIFFICMVLALILFFYGMGYFNSISLPSHEEYEFEYRSTDK